MDSLVQVKKSISAQQLHPPILPPHHHPPNLPPTLPPHYLLPHYHPPHHQAMCVFPRVPIVLLRTEAKDVVMKAVKKVFVTSEKNAALENGTVCVRTWLWINAHHHVHALKILREYFYSK